MHALNHAACALSALLPMCSGTTYFHGRDALGNELTAFCKWSKNEETKEVTIEVPPGTPPGEYTALGVHVVFPGNPLGAAGNAIIKITHKDPVILQIPQDWDLVSSTVTTPIGQGNAVLSYGPWVADVTLAVNGSIAPSAYYQAEPGYKLVMGDYPAHLAADGWNSGEIRIQPNRTDASFRVDRIKWINCCPATATSWAGISYSYLTPLYPFEHDFSQIQDEAHCFTVDFTLVDAAAPLCSLSGGRVPRLELVATQVAIGTTIQIPASQLDQGPFAFLFSDRELVVPANMGGNCYLRVDSSSPWFTVFPATADVSGNGSMTFSIPNDPNLIGFTCALQPMQHDTFTSSDIFGDHGKLRVELQ